MIVIDEVETRAAAEKILSDYRTARGIARMPVNQKITSAWSDGLPASTANNDPYAQRYIEQKESAQQYVDWIDGAIAAIPKQIFQELLRARYCEGLESNHPDMDAIDRLDISASKYFDDKRTALLQVSRRLHCTVYMESEAEFG